MPPNVPVAGEHMTDSAIAQKSCLVGHCVKRMLNQVSFWSDSIQLFICSSVMFLLSAPIEVYLAGCPYSERQDK